MGKNLITAIVMGAGQGSRMRSALPKSLHPVAGKPILARILRAFKEISPQEIRVVINQEHLNLIQPITHAFKAKTFFQTKSREGTASAVSSALTEDLKGDVLIVNGDHPLLSPLDLRNIIKTFYNESLDLCFGSYVRDNPGDYGRVIREKGKVKAIIEKSALNSKLAALKETNAGIYLIKAEWLKKALPQITNQNSKKEYVLTDLVLLSTQAGKKVIACLISEDSAFGVNTQRDLSFATKKIFTRKLNHLMNEGVIIIDPLNVYVEESVQVGQGSVIYPGVSLRGRTTIGSFSAIENNSFIMDSVIGDFALIRAGSYLESAEVGVQARIGPYARLRPGAKIGRECRVGNFAEVKKSHLGPRSKMGHFSYLGNAEVGEDVNIGAGAVTCNLSIDGKKHTTKIGDKVFIGSGVYMTAPVEIGDGSAVGAGSVITKNVPAGALALSRSPQKTMENYFHQKAQKKPLAHSTKTLKG